MSELRYYAAIRVNINPPIYEGRGFMTRSEADTALHQTPSKTQITYWSTSPSDIDQKIREGELPEQCKGAVGLWVDQDGIVFVVWQGDPDTATPRATMVLMQHLAHWSRDHVRARPVAPLELAPLTNEQGIELLGSLIGGLPVTNGIEQRLKEYRRQMADLEIGRLVAELLAGSTPDNFPSLDPDNGPWSVMAVVVTIYNKALVNPAITVTPYRSVAEALREEWLTMTGDIPKERPIEAHNMPDGTGLLWTVGDDFLVLIPLVFDWDATDASGWDLPLTGGDK